MRIKKVSQTTPVTGQIVNGYSESKIDGYSANYINDLTSSWTVTTYNGSVMSSTNGSVQNYSIVNIFVNEAGTMAYMTGTLYNNHAAEGSATITFNSALKPNTEKNELNLIAFYNNSIIGENAKIATDGKITMQVYGTANGNSRHTIIPTLIFLK